MRLDYAFRSTSMESLRQLSIDMGWFSLKEVDGEVHRVPNITGIWDEVGLIYEPTGEVIDTEYGPQPVTEPVKDKEGNPYYHVNFLWITQCKLDPEDGLPMKWSLLIETAQNRIATSDSATQQRLSEALQHIESICITEDGLNALDPKTPVRVFA